MAELRERLQVLLLAADALVGGCRWIQATYAPKDRDGVQRTLCGWAARGRWGLQVRVHLDEGRLRLREEVVHKTLAELALVLVIVHFEDLLKSRAVDAVLGAGNGHDVKVAALSN